MKTKLAILAILLLSCFPTFAEPTDLETSHSPLISKGEGPRFVLDYAAFQGINQRTYVEFYIQLPYEQVQFVKSDEGFQAAYQLAFQLYDAANKIVDGQMVNDSVCVATFAETVSPSKARVSLLAVTVEPGVYRLEATIRDGETRKLTKLAEDLLLPSFTTEGLLISDLQLSSKIHLAEHAAPYVKNQRYIEPNPSKIFTADDNNGVYVYFEVYNLNTAGQKYTTIYTFRDKDGNKIAELEREYAKPGPTSACSLRFPAEHFKPGEYVLTVETRDGDNSAMATRSTKFSVLQPPVELSQNTN